MQPGERWIAHIPEEGGHIAVVYLGVAPSLIIPEGGGQDLVIPQARVMLPDDREVSSRRSPSSVGSWMLTNQMVTRAASSVRRSTVERRMRCQMRN